MVRQERFWTEARYKFLNWLGILVNLFITGWESLERGRLDYFLSGTDPFPPGLKMLNLKLKLTITGLNLISTGFLADSLRRLRDQFNKDSRLAVNKKTMCLHVTVLFIHISFVIVNELITIYTFLNPNPKNKDYLNITRTLAWTSQSISQTIMIYLFVQFSQPPKAEGEDSDSEEEINGFRDPNMDMLYYTRQMPKMQRIKNVGYDIDQSKGAMEVLFDERDDDGEFRLETEEPDFLVEESNINGFNQRVTQKWGKEETKLRMAVFVSFVKESDTLAFRKKTKKARVSVRLTTRNSCLNASVASATGRFSINEGVVEEPELQTTGKFGAALAESAKSDPSLSYKSLSDGKSGHEPTVQGSTPSTQPSDGFSPQDKDLDF